MSDDEDDWVERAVRDAPPCPRCAGTDVRPVIAGMPSVDDFDRLDGVVHFAGCLVGEVLHEYRCETCGELIGPYRPTRMSDLEDPFAGL